MAFDLNDGWDAVGFPRVDLQQLRRPGTSLRHVATRCVQATRLPPASAHRLSLHRLGCLRRLPASPEVSLCHLPSAPLLATLRSPSTAATPRFTWRRHCGGCMVHHTTMTPFGPLTAAPTLSRPRLGPHGDLLTMDYAAWPPLDGLVVGPPCPPWSTMGHSVRICFNWSEPALRQEGGRSGCPRPRFRPHPGHLRGPGPEADGVLDHRASPLNETGVRQMQAVGV